MLTIALAVLVLVGAAAALLILRRARSNEARYRALLENLPQTSVVLFDRELRVQRMRGHGPSRDQRSPAELEGERLEDVFGGERTETLRVHYEAALRGESRTFEHSAENGREYWMRVVPIRHRERLSGGMAVSVDVTDRKRAERGRERSEVGRRLVVDAMNEAYVAIDERGRIIDWNERASEMFGYSREEVVGAVAPELIIPSEDRDEFWWLLERFTTGKRADRRLDLRVDRTGLHRDGHTFPVELAAATMRHDGEITLHTFMHDISERQRDRAALEAHAADVEALAEATRSLARSTTAQEARDAICLAATKISAAEVALLLEPTRDHAGLAVTAVEGAKLSDFGSEMLPFVGRPSGAVRAFTAGEPLFMSDIAGSSSVAQSMVQRTAGKSALWVPVQRDETAVGVIAVAWRERLDEVSERVRRTMLLAAAEAAVAIERAELLERLERMARTDDLTGLPNRRAWDTELRRELARARREHRDLSVAMVDLDYFKDYNDSRGHQAGDRLLKEAAGSWRGVLRETDVLARYGGEEFAIALPDCGAEQAGRLVERLRAVTPEGETCSAGVATWDGREDSDRLIGRADRALYEAKQSGRDRTISH